ncbi:hypothetical protein AMATHDRAFT_80430 [Amanita thiersii Skay4041]|uniref:Glutamate--cysteine ligase n=1 Tax=Amanita thiersii Skay4041 TaxID=703135 RepID=A0A2A9NP96_9AGAR|nr:hypothetical protein AMATHDRAFT_80430 [Amanita thiersii Skay4041]
MGLIRETKALTWEETKARAETIKSLGIQQFLRIWDKEVGRHDGEHKWGDEVSEHSLFHAYRLLTSPMIEYMLVHFDQENKNAVLATCQDETLEKLSKVVVSPKSPPGSRSFVTEFAKYMVETCPGKPYSADLKDLLLVESNMRRRREAIRQQLKPNEAPITLSSFPRLGAPSVFTYPHLSPSVNDLRGSLCVSEKLTAAHSHYETIEANMIAKRGSRMFAQVPIFVDKNTKEPLNDPVKIHYARESGCCCLPVTQQLHDLKQARKIYDALLPLTPLMMALSASSPAWWGYLTDVDCCWGIVSECLDERTREEEQRPRWDSSVLYIALEGKNKPEYNDIPVQYDAKTYEQLRQHGLDELISKHVACIFARQPLIAYMDDFEEDDITNSNHFESMNSTVWQAMRLKPPQGSLLGWRVEFRTIEASITDFESAAYAIFIVLMSCAILHYDLNLYVPISKVLDNMSSAQRRDAVMREKFTFRRVIHRDPAQSGQNPFGSATTEYEEMSLNEIFNGSESKGFPGLAKFVEDYIDTKDIEEDIRNQLLRYVGLIREKAKGTIATTATWIRNFVRSHPDYRFDSIINETIGFDLMMTVDKIARDELHVSELLPT